MNIEKNIESGPEEFPTKEVVLNIVNNHTEGLLSSVTKELYDDNGIFLIEVTTKGLDSEGYVREYTYSRKSTRTGEKLEPKIYLSYLQDDVPVGGEEIHAF